MRRTVAEAGVMTPQADVRPPWLTKRTILGFGLFATVVVFFLTQTRLPAVLSKFPTLGSAASARGRSTFGRVVDPASFPEPLRWVAYGVNLWDANAVGMLFAVLLAGAAIAALTPEARLQLLLRRRGRLGAGVGGGMGVPLFMCSACSAPVSVGFYRGGVALETALGMIFGSALFNPVGLFAIFLLLPRPLFVARLGFGLLALFVLVPAIGTARDRGWIKAPATAPREPETSVLDGAVLETDLRHGWGQALMDTLRQWWRHTSEVAVVLVPPMVLAGFLVGGVLQLAPPQGLSDAAGSQLIAIVLAAAVGTLLQLPTLFEIPLVLGVLALGLGPGPAAALLVTAPSAGPVTFAVTRRDFGWEVPALLLIATFAGGAITGLLVGAL